MLIKVTRNQDFPVWEQFKMANVCIGDVGKSLYDGDETRIMRTVGKNSNPIQTVLGRRSQRESVSIWLFRDCEGKGASRRME